MSAPEDDVRQTFSYKVNDGTADGQTATVFIAVNPVNDTPVAVVDSTTVFMKAARSRILTGGALSVLANDTDADLPPDTLSAILVSDVSHGSLTLNSDGTFSVRHDGSETASDSFSDKVNDGTADGNTVSGIDRGQPGERQRAGGPWTARRLMKAARSRF